MNNETKVYPKGFDGRQTTKEEWDAYELELKAHEERVEREKPVRLLFKDDTEYWRAVSQWEMMRSCDRPNKPGYYRANND